MNWTAGSINEEWIATRFNAMKCKQLAIRYQCMKGFSPQKVDRKLVFLARTLGLHLKTLTPKKNYIYWPLARSCVTQSCSYIISRFCSGMLLLSIFLAARCWQISSTVNNVISCPASYIYYSTKQNDGVEDYLDQTDNRSFLETRSVRFLLCLCCSFDWVRIEN